jgi:hypothetical protein
MMRYLRNNSTLNNKNFKFFKTIVVFVVLFLVVLLFIFNVRYLSRFFDWDSSVYALNIQRDRLHSVFFNPHHLGFESSGYLFLKIIKSWIPDADLMFTLRLRILIFACVFIFLFILIVYKMFGSIVQAIALGACVFFSQGFWFYSHHNDTPMIHSCLVVLLYFAFTYTANHGLNWKQLVGIGLLQLSTLYFHQSNAILFPMAIVSILVTKKWNKSDWTLSSRLYTAFLYCLGIGVAIILSYIVVGFGILGRDLNSFGEKHFSYWLFLYAAQERWGMSGEEKNYILFFYRGIGDAFLNFQGVNQKFRVDLNNSWNLKSAPYNINLFFWILIISLGVLNIRRMIRMFPKEILILSTWLIPSIAFYSWWEGYFFEFWVGVTIGLWIFSYLVFRSMEFSWVSNTSRALATIVLIFMSVFLFTFNFTYSTLPRSKNLQYGYVEGFKDRVERIANEKIYINKY